MAFSDKRVWPTSVIAHEDCVLLFLPPDKISGPCANICASYNTLIRNMLQILSNRSSMLDRKIEHMSAKTVRAKISSYFLDLYQQTGDKNITIPMNRYEMADYINIPRPSLSREMGLMRDDGIIAFGGEHITIKDVMELEKSIH